MEGHLLIMFDQFNREKVGILFPPEEPVPRTDSIINWVKSGGMGT
jgi:hypothetical protein